MASAAEHSHRRTNVTIAKRLDEDIQILSHVKIVDAWEDGPLMEVPPKANIKPHAGCGPHADFLRIGRQRLRPNKGTARTR